jgi:LppP/LprE lipoprotein
MAAHAMRFPPARRRRRWPLRMLGFLATVALLGCGAAIALMVMPARDHDAAATASPAPKTKAAHKAPGLTKAQKRARRNAVGLLAEEGYEPARLADWRPKAALKVLVGRDDQGAMRAFFFADGNFIGHDDAATSNDIRLAKAAKDAITLSYGVSTGGREKVRFQLADGNVEPETAIPPSTVR